MSLGARCSRTCESRLCVSTAAVHQMASYVGHHGCISCIVREKHRGREGRGCCTQQGEWRRQRHC